MSGVEVHGWRQQSTRRRDIQRWLRKARQHGFQHYQVQRYGQSYWLYCTTTAAIDIAAVAREQVTLPAAVVVQWESPWLYAVAWRQEQLLGVLRLPADHGGERMLWQLSESWLSNDIEPCQLVLAGADSVQQLSPPSGSAPVITRPAIAWQSTSRTAKTVSIGHSLPWIRRLRLGCYGLLVLLTISGVAWWQLFSHPVAEPLLTPPPALTTELEVMPPHLSLSLIAQRTELLRHVSYLAGWQVQRWQLTPDEERLWVATTYGTAAELMLQLPASEQWQWAPGAGTRSVRRAVVDSSEPLAEVRLAQVCTLAQAGYQTQVTARGMAISKEDFIPDQDSLLPLLAWLHDQPELRVTQVSAEQQGLHWRLIVELQA